MEAIKITLGLKTDFEKTAPNRPKLKDSGAPNRSTNYCSLANENKAGLVECLVSVYSLIFVEHLL